MRDVIIDFKGTTDTHHPLYSSPTIIGIILALRWTLMSHSINTEMDVQFIGLKYVKKP